MFDIRHDSPVPVHEQITGQIIDHIASGALRAGAGLAEYRALARQLLTHPQVVARAYADLEADGVLTRDAAGGMEVTSDAAVICRVRQQHEARRRLRAAVDEARSSGLADAEILKAVEQTLAEPPARPGPPAATAAITKKPTHGTGHRGSQGIQVLPRQAGPQPPEPDGPPGGDIRPARG